jgi:hypothetical protein
VTFVILNICSQLVHGQTVDGAHPPVIGKFGGPVDKNHQLLLLEGPANRFNLNCHVKAVPEAEILWYKDDSLIDGSSFEGIRLTPSHTETLEFTGNLKYLFPQWVSQKFFTSIGKICTMNFSKASHLADAVWFLNQK